MIIETTTYEVLAAIQARNHFIENNPKLHETSACHVLMTMKKISYHLAYQEIKRVLDEGFITYGSSLSSPWLTKEGYEYFQRETIRDANRSVKAENALSFTTK